jgi:hypothetical protein
MLRHKVQRFLIKVQRSTFVYLASLMFGMGRMHVSKGRSRGVHQQVRKPSKKNTYEKIRATETE